MKQWEEVYCLLKRKTRKIIEGYLRQYKKNLEENQKWNEIIEKRLNELNEEEIKLIKMRYFERKSINFITYELYMSRGKYFSMVNDILTEIALDAAYNHLLKR